MFFSYFLVFRFFIFFKEVFSFFVEFDFDSFIIYGVEFFFNGGELDKFFLVGFDFIRLRNFVIFVLDFIIIFNDLNMRKIINGYFF